MPKKYKRNANGSGSVSKLSGNRRKPWIARAPGMEDELGNFNRKIIGYFATRQEALEALYRYRLCPPAPNAQITLEKLFADWSTITYKTIGKSGEYVYNAAWKWLAPIKRYKVTEIKTAQFQFCVDRAMESGRSHATLSNIKLLAGRLEQYAIQQDIINKNYASYIVLPKKDEKEKEIFSDLDLLDLEKAAERNVGIADLILVMCYTGWRIGEFCALTRFSYDSKNHTLTGGSKTDTGKDRVVPIPPKIQKYIDKHLANDQAAIFCRREGGRYVPYTKKQLRKAFYQTIEELGIAARHAEKLTPHSTRHTYNSLLNKKGVDTKTRMRLMGHKDVKVNIATYTHTDLEQLKNAVNCL